MINCGNCGKELDKVYASRSVALEWDGEKWIESDVFSSGVQCPECYEELSSTEIAELGIRDY